MLNIIRKLDKKDKRSHAFYECSCPVCNKICIVTKGNAKKQQSCGCIRYGKPLIPGEVALNRLMDRYEWGASSRNLEFSLSREIMLELSTANCFYCGTEPKTSMKTSVKTLIHDMKYNGIDRINNKLGYVIGNIRTCCRDCNIAKASMTEAEFFNLIKRIAAKHKEVIC